jgi:hypothetical protein
VCAVPRASVQVSTTSEVLVTVNRAMPCDAPVGEVRIAEDAPEGVVADVQHPLAQVALAGDGEVPGEVEVVPGDPGRGQGGEDLLEVVGARAGRGPPR